MALPINHHVKTIEISGIRKFFNLVAERNDILSLTIGQPDFPTPEIVKEKAKAAIDQNLTTYTPNHGLKELREAVSHYLNETYLLETSYDEVLITVGASQALDIALRTILSPGDEVIVPSPIYPGYQPLIEMQGATVKEIDTTASQFKLTLEQLEGQISEKTRCLILPYPSNPTGVSLTQTECEMIAAFVKKHNLYLITDEIYSALTFDFEHFSMGRIKAIKDQLIVINGLSKSHAMTGWRIGFLVASQALINQCVKVLQYSVSCASSISQYAALAAVTEAKTTPVAMREAYKERRDYVYHRLTAMGLTVVKPDGAFYFMFKIPHHLNAFDLALDILEQAKVAFVPGSSFGQAGEGYLRLSYAYSMDTLVEGLDRLAVYLSK